MKKVKHSNRQYDSLRRSRTIAYLRHCFSLTLDLYWKGSSISPNMHNLIITAFY